MANEQTPARHCIRRSVRLQLVLQGVYLKDCSFEAPQGPRANGEWNPQISLDLNTNVQPIGGDLREVVLTVTVSAKQGEQTLFLVEVKQAGAFACRTSRPTTSSAPSAASAPACCFPYARAVVSQLVSQGGVPAAAAAAGQLRRAVRQLAEREPRTSPRTRSHA